MNAVWLGVVAAVAIVFVVAAVHKFVEFVQQKNPPSCGQYDLEGLLHEYGGSPVVSRGLAQVVGASLICWSYRWGVVAKGGGVSFGVVVGYLYPNYHCGVR